MNTKAQTKQSKSRTIRVSDETSVILDKLLKEANKKKLGSKIFPDQIVAIALGNVSETDVEKMQNDSLSNEDRKEQLRQLYIKKCGKITRDEFTGFMMTPAFFEFLNEHKQGLSLTA